MRKKFDKDPLAAEQNKCATRTVNVYILYEFDTCSEVPLNNFKLKNCLFGATNIVKNSDKEKWLYRGYGVTFDGAGSWNFGNDCAKNVVILLLIIVHLFMPIIATIIFYVR